MITHTHTIIEYNKMRFTVRFAIDCKCPTDAGHFKDNRMYTFFLFVSIKEKFSIK